MFRFRTAITDRSRIVVIISNDDTLRNESFCESTNQVSNEEYAATEAKKVSTPRVPYKCCREYTSIDV